jgi:hypothetical protein
VERILAVTVNTTANKVIAAGNGATTVFSFGFIGVASQYISAIFTDALGNQTVLTEGPASTQYQVSLNAPVAGAIWGIGGTVTYNPSGTPIANGTTLTIFRNLPLVQAISLANQASYGQYAPSAEQAIDILEMQLQQVSEAVTRVLQAPISDPANISLTLPTAIQRANTGLAFDSAGNVIAGTTPATGLISSAMAPVVNAATLALGRSNLGLKAMAQEGIGAGIQDDGAGNARVDFTLASDATNQAVTSAFHLTERMATGPITYTLPRANTLWNGFGFWIHVVSGGVVTIAVDAHDTIESLASGASGTLYIGQWAYITTDAAASGNWRVSVVSTIAGAIFGNGIPWADVTAWGAVGDFATDCTAAIQNAINYIFNNFVGGIVFFPGGNYKVTSTITVKGGVRLVGSCMAAVNINARNSDINVLNFQAGCSSAGLEQITIVGFQTNTASHSTVAVANGAYVVFRDAEIIGGLVGLNTAGVDCVFDNCTIDGFQNNVVSTGANWYIRCKIDTVLAGSTPTSGFTQGAYYTSGVAENHFVQCDFSGTYTNAIVINDTGQGSAVTTFEGCVFSSPISITHAVASMFSACEFGSTSFTCGNNVTMVTGSYAFSATVISGAGKVVAGCSGIS